MTKGTRGVGRAKKPSRIGLQPIRRPVVRGKKKLRTSIG